jgi:lipopolysaccharide transport system ATP-binding protein
MPPIIEVQNLSKKYRLGVVGATTLREDFARMTSRLRGREPQAEKGEFWALRDVSFSARSGEAVGIIGRNGAGKSTLLKILSRITEPTSGRAVLRGRVASLLEVGTGFHQDLTGRENVFLNGAILGMKRPEIAACFDNIISFAEVEKFIDTPVKHYSSGMYVRLAFAVAAHLQPEILIVDEVLAVGDTEFQKKCLGKMHDVAGQGRTVLFVSHNMAAVQQLTSRSLLLENGRVVFSGDTSAAIDRYVGGARDGAVFFDVASPARRGAGDAAAFESLRFERARPVFAPGEPLSFVARIRLHSTVPGLRFSVMVATNDGTAVGNCFGPEMPGFRAGEVADVRLTLPFAGFAPGHYCCTVAVGRGVDQQGSVNFDVVTDSVHFEVGPLLGPSGTFAAWPGAWGAVVLPRLIQTRLAPGGAGAVPSEAAQGE